LFDFKLWDVRCVRRSFQQLAFLPQVSDFNIIVLDGRSRWVDESGQVFLSSDVIDYMRLVLHNLCDSTGNLPNVQIECFVFRECGFDVLDSSTTDIFNLLSSTLLEQGEQFNRAVSLVSKDEWVRGLNNVMNYIPR
jgi:hypothetical protein